MAQVLMVEPIGKLLHAGQLVGAFVQASYFDDVVFRRELYIGEIVEVKERRDGTWVLFKPEAGQRFDLGKKWRPLSTVKGYVWYEDESIVKAMTA